MNKIKNYFEKLRFDKTSHLGLGDIRLTMGQQEDILSIIKDENKVNFLKELKLLLDKYNVRICVYDKYDGEERMCGNEICFVSSDYTIDIDERHMFDGIKD